MTHKSTFEIGREHYLRKEYEEAVRCFMIGSAENSSACMGWLGQCYEFGLGVKKNLPYAKDMYIASYENLYHAERSDRFGLWLSERINALKDIPLPESESRHIPGLGNIRVVKSKYSFIETKIRYNKLHDMIVKYEAGTLNFEPSCSLETFKKQASAMGNYLYVLEVRAQVEGIDLKEA
jgi:TPR repeat protein